MLIQGVTLTIIGMLVVFFILVLLVFAMKALSAAVFRFIPEPKGTDTGAGAAAGGSSEIAAAIAAAYHERFRK